MTVQGKLFKKFDTQQISDRFKKREFVLEYADNPMYPQFVLFQLTQDRVSLLDAYAEGAMVEIDFNLRGREWINPSGEKKYFNSLEAWRMNPVQTAQPEAMGGADPLPTPPPDALNVAELEDGDDLPF